MAETSIPTKREIQKAIVYSNLAGREFGRGAVIKVYFMPDAPGYKPYTDAQVAADPTLAEVNASYIGIDSSKYQVILDNVFGPWAKLANISFERTDDPVEAQIRVGAGVWKGDSVNVPGNDATGQVNSVFIRPDYYLRLGTPANFFVDSKETHDLMHEVGHSIGLNHPALPQKGGTLPTEYNYMPFTVMTNLGPSEAGWGPSTPSLFDAVGMETLYGLRSSNETDNYVIAPNTGRLIIDSGGIDTLNASATSTDNEIDLRATDFANGKTYLSSIGLTPGYAGTRYNVAIYEGTVIENAIGGGGKDTLIGNDIANVLDGGAGDDTLLGGKGADTYKFSGSFGKDTIDEGTAKGGDNAGTIIIGTTTLEPTGDMVGKYILDSKTPNTYRAKINGQDYTYTLKNGDTTTGTQLVIAKKGDTANTVTINHVDKDALFGATGYLGIKLQRPVKAAFGTAGSANPFEQADATPADLNSSVSEGNGTGCKLFLAAPAKAGDTLILNGSGPGVAQCSIVLGDNTVALAGGVSLTLTEGQTEVAFALVNTTELSANTSVTLSASYTSDGQTATSANTETITLVDGGTPTHTYTGDQHAPTRADGSFDWGATSWAADGSLTGGVPETNYADVIDGTDTADKITGLGGNDALDGGDGNDQIDGGDGDDLIGGGLGSDTIQGGAGNDYITSSATLGVQQRHKTTDHWTAPQGSTTITQGPGWGIYKDSEGIFWWEGANAPSGNDGDVIDGGAGNDWIIASAGNDYAKGGADDDNLDGMGGDDILEGNDGKDTLHGDGIIKPGYMNSLAAQYHGADFIDGGAGDDTLTGGGGNDQLYGGANNDNLYGDSGGNTANADYVNLAYHGNDYLDGEDGDDYLEGGGKDDTLYGGMGNDRLWGDTSVSNVATPADAALLWGNDSLDGENGDDELVGDGKDDTLYGGTASKTVAEHHEFTRATGRFCSANGTHWEVAA